MYIWNCRKGHIAPSHWPFGICRSLLFLSLALSYPFFFFCSSRSSIPHSIDSAVSLSRKPTFPISSILFLYSSSFQLGVYTLILSFFSRSHIRPRHFPSASRSSSFWLSQLLPLVASCSYLTLLLWLTLSSFALLCRRRTSKLLIYFCFFMLATAYLCFTKIHFASAKYSARKKYHSLFLKLTKIYKLSGDRYRVPFVFCFLNCVPSTSLLR